MYIADYNNQRVRKVTASTGIITTIAGSTTSNGYSGDNGQATAAGLNYPVDVALDSAGTHSCALGCSSKTYIPNPYLGNVYIADSINHRIRKVTVSTGIISTIAGNGGTGTYSGDNGQATVAELYYPQGLTLDSAGNSLVTLSFLFRLSLFLLPR